MPSQTKGLDALRVSLTKNGYFKIAEVIKKHPRDQILDNLSGVYDGINLDAAQIKNMLSYNEETQEFPEVWDEIRQSKNGDHAVDSLVFIAIIFSASKLINVLSSSTSMEMRGCIKREDLGDKVYTNLVHSMQSQGMCKIKRGDDETHYDVSPLFQLAIGSLVKKIITLKLEQTGWREPIEQDYFYRTFYEQCEYYQFHKVLGLSKEQFHDWLEGEVVSKKEPPEIELDDRDIKTSATLMAALSSKPFVILSGTTGTGKTRTIRDLAMSINPVNTDSGFNHVFIPVEAGWTDGRHLLGYKNPFGRSGETYVTTRLIEVLLKANYPAYRDIPFFIILDEMNLSHVEMYFSKFLSVMEVSKDGSAEALLGVEELQLLYMSGATDPVHATYILNAIEKKGLYLTDNVFVVGTVNMDETTYMFSPKVLDRSFVIQYSPPKPSTVGLEFSVHPDDLLSAKANQISEFIVKREETTLDSYSDQYLDDLYDALGSFRFGPRTTNEIRRYISICSAMAIKFSLPESYIERKNVLDRLTVQKVLPRIHGNRDTLSPIFNKLRVLFDQRELEDSSHRIEQMQNELTSSGFANYFSTY